MMLPDLEELAARQADDDLRAARGVFGWGAAAFAVWLLAGVLWWLA